MRFSVHHDHLRIGSDLHLSFQRTLRIPDDNKIYPLPPGLGCFPIRRVEDYADRVPEAWRERGGAFIPMYQREAMWLAFECPSLCRVAVQIGIGKINAITGKRWRDKLNKTRQNYVVCPDQPWLDGINAGDGFIRQFVAMPLGSGVTVEGQLTGGEEFGGIQIRVVEPKPGMVPELGYRGVDMVYCLEPSMGLGAGGRMTQKIYPDPYGWDTWDEDNEARVFVHIANSEMYREITGEAPPPTPIDVETYIAHGYPWFDLYDGDLGDVAPSAELAGIQSVQSLG